MAIALAVHAGAACGGDDDAGSGDGGGAGQDGASASPHGDAAIDAAVPDGIQTGTSIRIADGELAGVAEGGARRFLGIPYGKAPVGALRFAAPEKSEPWDGVRDASEFGGRCAQPSSLNTGAGTDNEDCLYLNVWAPDPAPEGPLPVLFWIHGGGNETGSTSDLVPIVGGRPFYDGQWFAAHHDVVVVSANYRLGVFGYLAHAALREEGSPSGNQGLLDQRLALQWVRDNIPAFGGDPDDVTIFGESAGARNVCFQVVSPGSAGLFHRAISESGDCTGRIATRAEAEAQAEAYVASVGCDAASDVLACLRELPAADLMVAVEVDGGAGDAVPGGSAYSGGTPLWDFRPVVDGDVVPAMPRQLFAMGAVAEVPYLMGTNAEEGALSHLSAPPATTEDEYLTALERRFGDFAAEVAAMYPVSDFDTPNDALIRVSTDSRYACAVQVFAEIASTAGLPVYAYAFDLPYAIPGLESLVPAHAAELTYVFHSLGDEQWSAEQRATSDLMQGYWSAFARTGDPNFGDAPEWTAFDPDAGNRLEIDADPSMVDGFRSEPCAMWRDYYASLFAP